MAQTGSPQASDRELIAAIAAGDTEALRTLNLRYGRTLAALAWRFLRNQMDAEEVAADVLWQAWREAKSFDPARGSAAAWLLTLARSRSIDRVRAIRARETGKDPQPAYQPAPDPVDELYHAERVQIVNRALTALDEGERNTLELAYFSDLSHSQIAQRLGLPLGTVKTTIRRAMCKLRDALAGRQA